MERREALRAGAATCTLCGTPIRPDDDAVVTPDFIGPEEDPDWRFSDAALHRVCFFTWEGRKAFVARFNRLARRLVAPDGSYPFLTAEGYLIRRRAGAAPRLRDSAPRGRGPADQA